MPKNIFVIGLDDFNQTLLEPIGKKKIYCFHSLLAVNEVNRQKNYIPEELLLRLKNAYNHFPDQ
ncbi:MAG: hypothetical protein NMNS01_26710 [Nitrosomonas sp.]|nr:MAG: hypothetical protein NMNS01_26710 [Nitrosomonas sp.]